MWEASGEGGTGMVEVRERGAWEVMGVWVAGMMGKGGPPELPYWLRP